MFGFNRARVSTEGPVDVDAEAFCVKTEVEEFPGTFLLLCSGTVPLRERLFRSEPEPEPKLRVAAQDGEIAHLRRMCARFCRRAGG